MLRVQQLSELEEILAVKREEEEGDLGASGLAGLGGIAGGYLPASRAGAVRGRALMQEMWSGRLRGVQRNVEVWQALLRCGAAGWWQGGGRVGRWGERWQGGALARCTAYPP